MAKTQAKARRPVRKTDQPVVTVRIGTGKGLEEQVRRSAPIAAAAEEWTYILRARPRWRDVDDVRESFRERAIAALAALGLSRGFLKKVARVPHVEVELHPWDATDAGVDAIHEAASTLPWEYLLSAATRGLGRYRQILITRLCRSDQPAVIPPPPSSMLFIGNLPGRLAARYDLSLEHERIGAALGADGRSGAAPVRTMVRSDTDTIPDIRRCVRQSRWDALHVTGIDTHQAAWLVDGFYDERSKDLARWNVLTADGDVRDGMVLRDANVAEQPVPYDALAEILVNPKHPPSIVTLNLHHSGARTAREMVRRGANAAIGFLDEIDDELAELFFQAFYWAWCQPGISMDIPRAFVAAWEKMTRERLHGTGITMWFGRSVFDKFRKESGSPGPSAGAETPESVHERLTRMPVRELLQVQIDTPSEINYSLLHNDRPVLTRLTLTKLVDVPLEDVRVLVELNMGADNYPFRTTILQLSEPQLELAPKVRVPLTASLPRSLRDRVQSTIYVRVQVGERTAWESTERITLIPVDEWVDDTDKNPWLPSFVLPRDPAILQIVAAARRYLIGIRDDPAAGFDGYQAIDDDAENPTAGVDAQVQALWSAIVSEWRLQYINPPPSYSHQSQRLRTPSEIVRSNSGTCIDLALLLASVLEYVEIYPVLVLLTGHAFVGYWRSEDAHERFVNVLHVPADVPSAGSSRARGAAVRMVDEFSWRLTVLHYDEVMDYVTSGDLVMLEATCLTNVSSFADAMTEGRANLRSRREFDSLLDINLARSATPPVTPLPIVNE